MMDHAKRVLEFDAVLSIISGHATWPLGREEVRGLGPLADGKEIRRVHAEIAEALAIMSTGEPLAFGGLTDTRGILGRALKGGRLEPAELLEIRILLEISRLTRKFLTDRRSEAGGARVVESDGSGHLVFYGAELAVDQAMEREISRSVGEDGKILDSAGADLGEIRQRIRTLQGRIHQKLNSLLRDPHLQKILQEPIITQREDRFVVPVRQEMRSSFPGLVLDQSASGATVFMEPLSIVPMTNELRQARLDERREEDAVLKRLSERVGREAVALEWNLRLLARLDCIFALARYCESVGGILPVINESGHLIVRQGRHPLLKGKVVPIDLEAGGDFHTLIITGPNTGGKTVTLKTLGLLSLMGLSGLPLPAGSGTEVPVFRSIFADIGDEQSIAQNLSTFSSHMRQIIEILPLASSDSLVLLDELGAGTDPAEGTALGTAILEHLHARKARTVVTTHYGELKTFGVNIEGASNAAVEFDVTTLRPTYRVLLGLPGRSCALEVAAQLGLDEDVIRRGRQLLGESHQKMNTLLAELEKEREDTARAARDLKIERQSAEDTRREHELKLRALGDERMQLLERAAGEAENLVAETRAALKELMKETRQKLAALHASREERLEADDHARLARSRMDEILDSVRSFRKAENLEEAPSELPPLEAGSTVRIRSLGQEGRVLEQHGDGRVEVQVGLARMMLPREDVVLVPSREESPKENLQNLKRLKLMSASTRLDVRGMRAEEAIEKLEKFIDDACLAELPRVEILHGKGSGALMRAVREYLKGHGCVKSFRLGEQQEGSWGVTVAFFQ